MSQTLFSSQLTLEDVRLHFEQWRQTRLHSRSKIPDTFWQEALSLAETYPITQVCKQLRLNPGNLNKYRYSVLEVSEPTISDQINFVEVDVRSQPSKPIQVMEIVFERYDGLRMKVHNDEGFELSSLMDHFIRRSDVSSQPSK
ncbi:hypothetical protein WDW89_16755 [Deltaproteobacteria bacterium TL4]